MINMITNLQKFVSQVRSISDVSTYYEIVSVIHDIIQSIKSNNCNIDRISYIEFCNIIVDSIRI